MTGTRISIGIPFRSNETTLPLAVRSVFAQTESDWELLLLDDGSSDESLALAQAISDPRVTVLADGGNRGLAARLNELTSLSSGEYIVRMDADDAMHPSRVERQVELLDADPDIDLVASRAFLMDAEGNVYGMDSASILDDDPAIFLRRNQLFAHPTMTARREWMLKHPYDPSFRRGQEKELFCRTYGTSTFVKQQDPMLFYREAGQVDFQKYREQRRMDRRLLRMYGPTLMGRRDCYRAAGVTYAKEVAYGLSRALGAERRFDEAIAKRRASTAPPDLTAQAEHILDRVRGTAVPGWD